MCTQRLFHTVTRLKGVKKAIYLLLPIENTINARTTPKKVVHSCITFNTSSWMKSSNSKPRPFRTVQSPPKRRRSSCETTWTIAVSQEQEASNEINTQMRTTAECLAEWAHRGKAEFSWFHPRILALPLTRPRRLNRAAPEFSVTVEPSATTAPSEDDAQNRSPARALPPAWKQPADPGNSCVATFG